MKAQLTQEAKEALIKEFNRLSTYSAWENNRRIWMPDAIFIIESFPVSDGWIPVSEYKGWDVITYNVEYDPQEHRTNEWIWIHYDNEFWKISNTATHYKPLPNPPTSHK